MPVVLAFLMNPITWAVAAAGAFVGSQVDDKLDSNPTNSPMNTGASNVDWNKVIFYSGASLALAYGAKKVFNIKW